jgi:enoyl-[acyl-carrier protein] reductase II
VRVPVVAAGGIADGRGLVAAFALGACGIQLGTRLIASVESEAPDGYKARVLAARETDTLVSDALTGKPVRALATPALRAYDEALRRGASAAELAELRRAARLAPRAGGREEYPAVAGQIAGMVREILPVHEILDGILREASEVYRQLGRWLEDAPAGSEAWSRSATSSD